VKRSAGALAVMLLARGAAAEPACSARVLLEPESAYVGQQIVYRLQIARRTDVSSARFTNALSFPSFRVEWLHGQSPDPLITGVDGRSLVAEERRALFPVRAGTLAIPPARIECETQGGPIRVDVPAAAVAVRDWPAEGRPPDFRGVVGRVVVSANLAKPVVQLGDSVRLAVELRGEANVWDAAPPLDAASLPGVEVIAHDATLDRVAGRRLGLRRDFAYDLVPRAAGAVRIPALRVPWLDPATGRYEVAEAPGLRLEVTPEPAAAPTVAPPSRAPRARDWSGLARLAVFAAGLGLLGVLGARLARPLLRARAIRRAAATALGEADAAAARGDARAASQALASGLRDALALRVPGSRAATVEELARHEDAAVQEAAAALADLERARFAAPAAAGPALDAARVRALVRALSE
jgi:hypothetical protein